MEIGNILNVAISLVFLFVVMSMIASTVQELAAGMWNSRGRYLQESIAQMLGDPALNGLAGRFYKHPLITGLLPPGTDWPALAWLRRLLPFVVPRLPSYITPVTFVDALTDLLARAGAFETGAMQPALATLWRAANQDQAAFKAKLAEWYTATTERQTGHFKRNVQRWLFAYGLLAAVFLNIDTLTIASALWSGANQQQAATIAAQAAAFLKAHPQPDSTPPGLEAQLDTLAKMKLPIGWGTTDGCVILRTALGKPVFSVIPGFICAASTGSMPPLASPAGSLRALTDVDSARWLGWILTALAISLGAQFWFDLLGKIINLRGAGAPAAPPKPAPAASPQQ